MFLCVLSGIAQNVQNEVLVERSIFADFVS